MENSITLTQERSIATESTTLEMNKVGTHLVTITSAFMGCWAVVCLVSATISSGGPGGLVSNFISAFVG